VDLPDPVGPTTATVLPAGTSKVTPESVGREVPANAKSTAVTPNVAPPSAGTAASGP
jgi:hypothetical protein